MIDRPPDEVWALVGDPARLNEWFPITGCRVDLTVEPRKRWVDLASGVTFEEDIVTLDDELRRFQYRITSNPLITHHLGTVDVLDDGRGGSVVVYSTDCTPDVFALLIGGAAGEGLEHLSEVFV